MKILVAGVGNIFLGDDAFGVEMVRELARLDWPAEVCIVDFGIRSYDLSLALEEGCDAVILVDATQRGEAPGTIYLLEPGSDSIENTPGPISGHTLNPSRVLQRLPTGAPPGSVYVVGCEPAVLECEEGQFGLSPAVRAAIPQAREMICSLISKLRCGAAAEPHQPKEESMYASR